jgi:transcription initiation factor TFIIIB Brf1 subunit/transcription initiation factor TFIIB
MKSVLARFHAGKMTKIKKDECAECGSKNVHYNKKTQQIVCRACGAIFEEMAPAREKKFEKAHDQG